MFKYTCALYILHSLNYYLSNQFTHSQKIFTVGLLYAQQLACPCVAAMSETMIICLQCSLGRQSSKPGECYEDTQNDIERNINLVCVMRGWWRQENLQALKLKPKNGRIDWEGAEWILHELTMVSLRGRMAAEEKNKREYKWQVEDLQKLAHAGVFKIH